ncbi:putative ferredoxin [Fulvimarina pelagi HTCC2506]|uniref:Putative ferredoxin n=1 Tax=Fulvimarina pelagi HTCC2506 TaxID=314231 RepID=Q0G153_9HYPH|nr:4Fe-4S binding protein [Fulvimarina pelagi]EAU40786.1 putative ferredoxin [Fulvimarina pelagi HTCC2506]
MASTARRVLVCNCEKSMSVDGAAIGRALGGEALPVHTHLCRSGIAAFETALASGDELIVACTQESPLFAEIAEEQERSVARFFNIREAAGWTADGRSVAPKMAALAAVAAVEGKPARLRTFESDGLCLLVGKGQAALDAAQLLNRDLSVTLLLADADDVILPEMLDFPIFKGKVTAANGTLGRFEVTVDDYAAMLPSSRGAPQFAMPRNGAKSTCSVIVDISGEIPLFARPEGRDGYVRADPRDPAAVMRAIFEASAFEGEFEKPIYVTYDASICAHERSRKTGCTKCIDVCPPGAITPAGDEVLIDTAICGGCGNCAAHCPTGAVSYTYPQRSQIVEQVQTLASTFLGEGGTEPVLLVHDERHGKEMINAMARLGRGLPVNVLPLPQHSTTGVGHDLMVAALGAGFRSIVILVDPRRSDETVAMREEIALVDALLSGLGHAAGRVAIIEERDPDAVEGILYDKLMAPEIARGTISARGSKRDVARTGIQQLADAGTPKGELIALPASAPYGTIHVDKNACTLCMACVSACPVDALRANPDKPQLRFVESACVQCGICSATCPENAITLEARYNVSPEVIRPVTLNEDEPAECIRCGTPFVARGMLERVSKTLAGKHWMFQTEERKQLLRMCDSCRLEALSADGGDPFAIAHRSRPRTTEDYINAEKKGLTVEDFFSDD